MNAIDTDRVPTDDVLERIWERIELRTARRMRSMRKPTLAILVSVLLAAGGTAAYAASGGLPGSSVSSAVPTPRHPIPGRMLPNYFNQFSALPGFVDGGFATDARTSMSIFWNGPLSERAKKIIAAARAHHFEIDVTYVKYSDAQMTDAMSELSGALAKADVNVWSLGFNSSYSGIDISGPDLSAADNPAVQQIAAAAIGNIPVTIVPFDPALLHPADY